MKVIGVANTSSQILLGNGLRHGDSSYCRLVLHLASQGRTAADWVSLDRAECAQQGENARSADIPVLMQAQAESASQVAIISSSISRPGHCGRR